MPHFFGERNGDRVTISGDDARHLARSLRARPGEEIAVVEPAGRLLTVRLERVSADAVTGVVVAEEEHHPEPSLAVTMAIALLPANALELVLSRCTELGAQRFVLIEADRSVARAAKPERWATICREAAMLAGRLRVPEVAGPVTFEAALSQATNAVVLDRAASERLADFDPNQHEITLFIGPEGGWSEREIRLARDNVRSLGKRNLRADTAAAAALSALLARSGDL